LRHYQEIYFKGRALDPAFFGWRSAQAYFTQPALANGAVYVARNDTPVLEVLDERVALRRIHLGLDRIEHSRTGAARASPPAFSCCRQPAS
jgi:hypothetical protein